MHRTRLDALRPRSPRRSLIGLAGLAIATLGALSACGGGGSGSGELKVKSTIFGYDPFTGNFDASGQQGEAPLIPYNMSVIFDFSDAVRPTTVNSSSIVVQELDTSVSPPAPGPLAAVTYTVTGNRIVISPLVTFTDTNVTFGWGDNNKINQKTYQVLFQVAPSTSVVTSIHGRQLVAADRGPYLFKTSTQIFDQQPGAPVPTMKLLDPNTGATLTTSGTPASPVPLVEIDFNEPVIPPSAVNPGGTGTSDAISVEIDKDGNLATTNDRIVLPGTYTLTETANNATVLWTSLLSELPTAVLPPDAMNGCLYVVTVKGTVQDLSGNNKVTQTNDPAAKDVFTFTTAPGASTQPVAPFVETFDSQANNDLTTSSAKWGTVFPGFLSAGIGGGTGADGAFSPASPTFQASPPSGITVTVATKTVSMNTESLITPGTQRKYEFTTYTIPVGWTVKATGKFPLDIQCSGNFSDQGVLDVSGASGTTFASSGAIVGGVPGGAALGGAAGGRGGAVTDSNGSDDFFPNKLGAVTTYAKLGFKSSSIGSQGCSGRNTSIDTVNYTLTDTRFTSNLGGLASTNLWLQPNIAADDYRFERNHTAFKVTSISSGVITVDSNPASPTYRGDLSQETTNPWTEPDGSGGFRPPLLAEQFDSYVIGELTGLDGSNVFDVNLDGVSDPATNLNGGSGSESQSVMQTFLTLARSGGGGGGGFFLAGNKGDDDPTVQNGPGFFGGTGYVGGAGGVAAATSTVQVTPINSITLQTSVPLFSVDGTVGGAPDSKYVGYLINPNVNQGNTFVIATVPANDTVTITPIVTSTGAVITLSNTTISVGNTVRLAPPYTVGGTGGGGAGVHCAGSSKTPYGHTGDPLPLASAQPGFLSQDNLATARALIFDDDNKGVSPFTQDGLEDDSEQIFLLPTWIPGGGGGAGGGALHVVSAGNIDVSAVGQILANGGTGGQSDLAGTSSASGGGGGSGGTIFLGCGGTLSVALGGKVLTAGGLGGASGFGIKGGDGATGRLRFENAAGNLSTNSFIGATAPPLTNENLGLFPGGGRSIAQTVFLAIGALKPAYQKVIVVYTAKENGLPVSYTYQVDRTGSTAGSTGPTAPPPFTVLLDVAMASATSGLVDTTTATAFADPKTTLLSSYDTAINLPGNPYFRFRVILEDPTQPLVLGGKTYTEIRIDSVEIDANTVKPQ